MHDPSLQIGGIGYGGDHPPTDLPGLVEFLDSLRVPELSNVRCSRLRRAYPQNPSALQKPHARLVCILKVAARQDAQSV